MSKDTPSITEKQIHSLLENFGSECTDSDYKTESTASDHKAVVPCKGQKNENTCDSVTSVGSKPNDHPTIQSKPTFRILVLTFILLLFTWLLPSANVTGLKLTSENTTDRDSFFLMSSQYLLRDSLKEIHEIPRRYILEMSETLTPAPDESKFSEIYDDERKDYKGKPVKYYKDDSIEVKCWRERINHNTFHFSEIWIADPSQLRRTLVDNVISKKHLNHPQNIFAKTNGVVGMTADYCAFRPYGIIIQYGNVVRETKGSVLDIAVYDVNGNFSAYDDNSDFFETDLFIEGRIVHTFAFGPVLVDDYKVSESYKLTLPNGSHPGELNEVYPRAAICQFGYDKHYLLCTVDFRGLSAKDFAGVLQSKGVRFAYNLDGGQTATLMFHKRIINNVAYGGTRPVSDILYFATAIPNN